MGLYRHGFIDGEKEGYQKAIEDVLKILDIFQDDNIYTGRIVKFEIKNRIETGEEKE